MRMSLRAPLLIVAASLNLGACVSYSLPGIPAQAGAADPKLQALVRRALHDQDQRAAPELGILYEYGRGVPVDWKIAGRLYAMAAAKTPAFFMASGNNGHAFALESGRRLVGIPEARERLKALRAKMAAAGIRCSGIGWSMLIC